MLTKILQLSIETHNNNCKFVHSCFIYSIYLFMKLKYNKSNKLQLKYD